MTDSAFRVPGSWGGDQESLSYYHRRPKSNHSTYSSDSFSTINSEFDKFSIIDDNFSITTKETNHNQYNQFIKMAKNQQQQQQQQKAVKKKKQLPITVSIEDNEKKYCFPFEFANNYINFQENLRVAFPEYRNYIMQNSIILYDIQQKVSFVPNHFESFIRPGQELIIKLQPLKKVQIERIEKKPKSHSRQRSKNYYDDVESDNLSIYYEDNEDLGSIKTNKIRQKKKNGTAQRLVNWLTD